MLEDNLDSEIKKQLLFLKNKAQEDLSINLTEEQLKQFSDYSRLLLVWNERVNLTAITEPREIMIKHFLDSLVFVKWLQKYYPQRNILLGDLGTGAGFPGIPIKIVIPEIKVVLIDSLAKRINFLNEVCSNLQLADIETFHARAEDVGRDAKYRERFDVTVARAVAGLPVLLEYTAPLLKVGGRLLAAKGVEPEQELSSAQKALQVLHCQVEHLEKYYLAEGAEHRSLMIIKKMGPTSSIYPRQAGKPKKSPL